MMSPVVDWLAWHALNAVLRPVRLDRAVAAVLCRIEITMRVRNDLLLRHLPPHTPHSGLTKNNSIATIENGVDSTQQSQNYQKMIKIRLDI